MNDRSWANTIVNGALLIVVAAMFVAGLFLLGIDNVR